MAVTRDGRSATPNRLGDKHVARLVKQAVRDADLHSDPTPSPCIGRRDNIFAKR